MIWVLEGRTDRSPGNSLYTYCDLRTQPSERQVTLSRTHWFKHYRPATLVLCETHRYYSLLPLLCVTPRSQLSQ